MVIEIIKPPPKNFLSILLHSCLSQTWILLNKAFRAPSFGGGCVIPITVTYWGKKLGLVLCVTDRLITFSPIDQNFESLKQYF